MVFSSAVFLLIFLPVVLLLYYAVPERVRNPLLLAASLIFYAWGEPVYILIMLFSTVFDYCNGLMLERLDQKGKPELRGWVLALSLTGNLGMLGFFKYTDFLISSVNAITGQEFDLIGIALPIGISFYTFQTLSYTIDVYRREIPVQHNIVSFGMYVCMFPQLIAGPIVKYRDIARQIDRRTLGADRICAGIFRFTLGLGKKVLLANSFGAIWDEISLQRGNASVTAIIGAAAYMLQIYFDFSGYSDMAIGIGKMLGFDFLENFNYPYAHFARLVVQGIPLHSARRQPQGTSEANAQSVYCLGTYRTLARRGLEFRHMGTVLLPAVGGGKAVPARPAPEGSGGGGTYIHPAFGAYIVGYIRL